MNTINNTNTIIRPSYTVTNLTASALRIFGNTLTVDDDDILNTQYCPSIESEYDSDDEVYSVQSFESESETYSNDFQSESTAYSFNFFSETSSDLYGEFSPDEQTFYGLFDEITNACTCGTEICDVHPSARSSGLYDPMDYNENAEYVFNLNFNDEIDHSNILALCESEDTQLVQNDQAYLDRLYSNTNDIQLIEERYLTLLKERYDFKVQSGWDFTFGSCEVDQNAAKYIMSYLTEDHSKYFIKLVEDIIYFVQLACETVVGQLRVDTIKRAVLIFLKLRYNESVYEMAVSRAIPYVTKLFQGFSVQSDTVFTTARELLNSYKNINESPIMIKLYKCCMYMMSYSLFDKVGISMDNLGYSKLEQAAMKKRFYKKTDFIYTLFDTALFVAERGYQVYITGDASTIFHSGGEYKTLFDQCRVLKRQRDLLVNPEEHGFTESEFRANLDTCIEKLESISKHSYRLDKTDIAMVRAMLNDMLMTRDDVNTKSAARRNRKAPFGILICGDSGIGKTTLTSIFSIVFAKHEKLPEGCEFCYTRNPVAQFWDGFTSSCHTVVLDDVANEAPELGDPKSLNEILQIMNNQAFCPNQASLENKGTTPFKAKLVIATTNVEDLNAYYYFSCPSAVQRRFPYIITPTVKSEFKDCRGMLNSANISGMGVFPELWTFEVKIVRPVPLVQGKRKAIMEVLLTGISLAELLKWYTTAIKEFNRDQTKVAECISNMRSVELCMCCNIPETLCSEYTPQSGLVQVFCGVGIMLIIHRIMKMRIMQYLQFCYKYYIMMTRTQDKLIEYEDKVRSYVGEADDWKRMGETMYSKIKHPRFLAKIAAILTTSVSLYKLYSMVRPQSGISDEIGTVPVAEANDRENVWYNNTMDLSVANFTRESSSSKSMEFTSFCKKISNNVAYIQVSNPQKPGTAISSRMICLGGHIWLTNNHNVPELTVPTTMKLVLDNKIGMTSNYSCTLSNSDIHRIPSQDIVFITLRDLPPMKKIIQFFQLGESNGIFNGAYAIREKDGSMSTKTMKKISLCKERNFNFPGYNINSKQAVWKGYVDTETSDGECGSPLIIDSGYGYSIVGIHFLARISNPKETYATSIDGNFIKQIYENLSQFNVECGEYTLVSAPSVQRELTDLHRKSVFRYLKDGSAHVYGSFVGFRGKSKSSVVNTPMSIHLKESGYKKKFTGPEMISWVPWHIAAVDLVKPINTLNTDMLNKCVTSYVSDVTGSMNLDDLKHMLMPLDNFTAINGAQVAYIDKINRNTSAGNPWKKSKKYFLTPSEPKHGMLDPVEVDAEIMTRVDEIISTYISGKQAHPNFCAHLKDEPVSFAKAKIGKTRVFTGATFDWTIVVRKFLLSFCRLQQHNRFAFEAAPGTIAQSLEWQEMYDYIVKHGKHRVVAGDYKAFDKKMSPKEILAAFDVIIHFCELSGNYSQQEIMIIRGIAQDTAFPLVDYNGDLVQLFGSNPSGHPLTVVINGIVNSLRMRYMFFTLMPESVDFGFKDCVNLMTYGDDNIMSVRKDCDWFNHTSIATGFAELDIIYTMADKEAASVPYINISEASFLKRTWLMDDTLGCYLAPLEHDSIEKMLMTWNRSKAVCEESQGISVITTALREYFFYGKDVYEEKLALLKELVTQLGWELFVEDSTFMTHEELCKAFEVSSKRTVSFDYYFGRHVKD